MGRFHDLFVLRGNKHNYVFSPGKYIEVKSKQTGRMKYCLNKSDFYNDTLLLQHIISELQDWCDIESKKKVKVKPPSGEEMESVYFVQCLKHVLLELSPKFLDRIKLIFNTFKMPQSDFRFRLVVDQIKNLLYDVGVAFIQKIKATATGNQRKNIESVVIHDGLADKD